MTIYYIIFFAILILAVFRDLFFLNQRICLFFCFVVLVLFAGLRDVDVSKDGENYVAGFQTMGPPLEYFTNFDDWFFFEPTYYLFPSILRIAFPVLYVFLVFVLFAIIGVHVNLNGLFRLSLFPILSVVVYYSHNYLLHELTQIRVGVACGFLLLSTYYHYHKNRFAFVISIMVALLFHYVALLTSLIFFLKSSTFSRKKALFILFGAMAIAVVRSDLLITPLLQLNFVFILKLVKTLQGMDEERNAINIFNVAFLMNFAILIWVVLKAHVIKKKNKYAYLAIKIHMLSVVLYFLFSAISMVAFRLYEFFGIISIITVPFVVHTFRIKIFSYCVVFFYALGVMAINLHVSELLKPYSLYKFDSLW